jgi:GR25 family glycosyltransferase involved in LPS biosynthesis
MNWSKLLTKRKSTDPFEFFDQIYCINCDRYPNRWDKVQKEFSRFGIAGRVVRFSAMENDKRHGLADPEGKLRYTATGLCHLEIISTAKAQGLDNVLIFEDDVSFLTDDPRTLSDAVAQLRKMPNWQLFYLGMNVCSADLELVTKNLLFGNKGNPPKIRSTHAYAIHRSTFDRVLAFRDSVFKGPSIDIWLPVNFNFYCLYPLFCVQDQNDKSVRFRRNFYKRVRVL